MGVTSSGRYLPRVFYGFVRYRGRAQLCREITSPSRIFNLQSPVKYDTEIHFVRLVFPIQRVVRLATTPNLVVRPAHVSPANG